MFSHWPLLQVLGQSFWPSGVVLALGFASGQYSNPQANKIGLEPVTGPIWKHLFNNIILFPKKNEQNISECHILLFYTGLSVILRVNMAFWKKQRIKRS